MNPDNLSCHEKEVLLRHFFHFLKMEDRQKLMATYPAIYNKACGREIVVVLNIASISADFASDAPGDRTKREAALAGIRSCLEKA